MKLHFNARANTDENHIAFIDQVTDALKDKSYSVRLSQLAVHAIKELLTNCEKYSAFPEGKDDVGITLEMNDEPSKHVNIIAKSYGLEENVEKLRAHFNMVSTYDSEEALNEAQSAMMRKNRGTKKSQIGFFQMAKFSFATRQELGHHNFTLDTNKSADPQYHEAIIKLTLSHNAHP